MEEDLSDWYRKYWKWGVVTLVGVAVGSYTIYKVYEIMEDGSPEIDRLTGLYNKDKFNADLMNIVRKKNSGDDDTTHVLALIDGDKLKLVNNESYNAADLVISMVGSAIKTSCQQNQKSGGEAAMMTGYHWGGDEFCLLFENCQKQFVLNAVESLIKDVAAASRNTISVGLTSIEKGDTVNAIFERSEMSLKQSKVNGGNRYSWNVQDAMDAMDAMGSIDASDDKPVKPVHKMSDVGSTSSNPESKYDRAMSVQMVGMRDLELLELFLKSHGLEKYKNGLVLQQCTLDTLYSKRETALMQQLSKDLRMSEADCVTFETSLQHIDEWLQALVNNNNDKLDKLDKLDALSTLSYDQVNGIVNFYMKNVEEKERRDSQEGIYLAKYFRWKKLDDVVDKLLKDKCGFDVLSRLNANQIDQLMDRINVKLVLRREFLAAVTGMDQDYHQFVKNVNANTVHDPKRKSNESAARFAKTPLF